MYMIPDMAHVRDRVRQSLDIVMSSSRATLETRQTEVPDGERVIDIVLIIVDVLPLLALPRLVQTE